MKYPTLPPAQATIGIFRLWPIVAAAALLFALMLGSWWTIGAKNRKKGIQSPELRLPEPAVVLEPLRSVAQRPGFVLHVTDEGGDLLRVREVGGMGGAPKLGRERPNSVLGPSDESDRSPGPREVIGERLADASRCAGDQHSFAA